MNSPNASICQHDLDATWVRVAVCEDGLYHSPGQDSRRLVFFQDNIDFHARLDIGADAADRDRFSNMLTDRSVFLCFLPRRIQNLTVPHITHPIVTEMGIRNHALFPHLCVGGVGNQQPHSSQYRVYGPPLLGWTLGI